MRFGEQQKSRREVLHTSDKPFDAQGKPVLRNGSGARVDCGVWIALAARVREENCRSLAPFGMTRARRNSIAPARSQRYKGKVKRAGGRPFVPQGKPVAPKTRNTTGEKNSFAGFAEHLCLLLRAAWGTGPSVLRVNRNACATERRMRGEIQRCRLEALHSSG